MTKVNSSSLSSYDETGERVLISSCTPLESALRYLCPDGLKIEKDKPEVSLKSNPIKPFDYWLCRHKGVPREVGSLVRDFHHGPPKDPARVNLCFLEEVVWNARLKTGWHSERERIEAFLKALFHVAVNHAGTLNNFQTLYFPSTDGKTGAELLRSSDKKRESFVPGQYVHFIQDGQLLNGTVKDAFSLNCWPTKYSVVRHENGPTYLVSHENLVSHQEFQRSIPSQGGGTYGVDYEWMQAMKRVFEGLGAKTSLVNLWACFHFCRCFSTRYDRLSWVRRIAESESRNARSDMIMVPESELVVQSYLKGRNDFEKNWEPFRIKEWVQNEGSYSDGEYAIIPEMERQSQDLYKGCALKVEIDDKFWSNFSHRDEETNTDTGK